MKSGTLTTIEHLAARLQIRWIVKWHEAFFDPDTGGFHERLGHSFRPKPNGVRRLLTQCRQIAIYSHALTERENVIPRQMLDKSFEFILKSYRIPETGGWRYSLSDSGEPLDEASDLYTLSFVIFSFSHYFRATQDNRAKDIALETLDFINYHFRMDGLPGLAEAVDRDLKILPEIRRQNPHMHLLEACLFAHKTWGGELFIRMADEMVDLFYRFFYNQSENRLCEFFRHIVEIPEEITGLTGKRCVVEMILDNVAFVLDPQPGKRQPLVFHHDLEVEVEAMFKPCAYDNHPDAGNYVSSPMSPYELSKLMSVVKQKMMEASGHILTINHQSKAERGFSNLGETLGMLQSYIEANPHIPRKGRIQSAFTLSAEPNLHRHLPQDLRDVLRERPIACYPFYSVK